jgi:hypothetical protein
MGDGGERVIASVVATSAREKQCKEADFIFAVLGSIPECMCVCVCVCVCMCVCVCVANLSPTVIN